MTVAELLAKWSARQVSWRGLGVRVDGDTIAREILDDIAALEAGTAEELFSPAQAAARSGYHPESISRLIRSGKLKNYGTKHRPRVRLADLPRKASATGKRTAPRRKVGQAASAPPSSLVGSIDAIARDAVAGRIGRG